MHRTIVGITVFPHPLAGYPLPSSRVNSLRSHWFPPTACSSSHHIMQPLQMLLSVVYSVTIFARGITVLAGSARQEYLPIQGGGIDLSERSFDVSRITLLMHGRDRLHAIVASWLAITFVANSLVWLIASQSMPGHSGCRGQELLRKPKASTPAVVKRTLNLCVPA